MRLVSFNINGIRARPHQLEALIEAHQPDVIGLQETKVQDSEFPHAHIEALGYHVVWHGQKGHYGVAMLTRQVPKKVHYGMPDDSEYAQKRMIGVEIDGPNGEPLIVYNGYFPQGENVEHPVKFPYKTRFYQQLFRLLEEDHTPDQHVVVMGDYNISATDRDIGIGEPNRKRWLREGKTSFQPIEREWMERLYAWGLTDSFRHVHPEVDDQFSWFDYRSRGFEREPRRGLRIDLIMTSPGLTPLIKDSGVDYVLRGMEKPSDHAPVWTDIG
ncbi:exodeoxyribonuclease III [Cobetia marina]|uniref:exodeoxyribonuclease III n=1 Tax=Cobetia marina TaxID=28258 RepID=UPI0010AE4449|nr:exodeoxyribonuclease III [Cobetia marina]TKD64936.1 exodeoxyribonuclease III [Cobetia marina]GED42209.1 exodeoxyribonuclease III [Cobetia marina]